MNAFREGSANSVMRKDIALQLRRATPTAKPN
jgi:hypothetical protein